MTKDHSYLRLVRTPKRDPEEPQNSENEALNTLIKAALIGAGFGGGIEAVLACFPNDIIYLTREDFPYRLVTAAAVTGILLPLQESGIKEGETPKNYFAKVVLGATGYAVATTMIYCGIESIMK